MKSQLLSFTFSAHTPHKTFSKRNGPTVSSRWSASLGQTRDHLGAWLRTGLHHYPFLLPLLHVWFLRLALSVRTANAYYCQIPRILRRRPYLVSWKYSVLWATASLQLCLPFCPYFSGHGAPQGSLPHPSCTHSPGFAHRHPPGFHFCSVAP